MLVPWLSKFINEISVTQEVGEKRHCSDSSPVLLLTHGMKSVQSAIAAVLIAVQISSPLPFLGLDEYFIPHAKAVLYSPDTKVPRTGELALRRAIPANTNMKTIQVVVSG